MHKIYFIAGLSNGETVTEGKGEYTVKKGEPSPYKRLLAFCRDNDVKITSFSLATADGRRWNIPSAGKNPKFHAFSIAPKPVEYDFFRKVGSDISKGGFMMNKEIYSCVEAKYEDGTRMQLWVSHENAVSWSLIV